VHHYPFHIGDYRKDTSNLSLLEHGIYRTLLDCLYLQEIPLTDDKDKLCRMIGARSPEEIKATHVILDDYFVLTEVGYTQDGCMKVLSAIYEKSEKARLSVAKRWAKRGESIRKPYAEHTNVSENDTNVSKNDTFGILPNTQHPTPSVSTSSGDAETKQVDQKIAYQSVVDLYHSILTTNPKVKLLSDKRKQGIKSCSAMKPTFNSLEFWSSYFESVKSSPWHVGENPHGWKADFDWLTNKANFIKMYERGSE